uniref:Isoliquiritigenin dimethylallyltransferase n=1 Tax=Sophora flavescens TaxID=49840 RepID=F8WPJ1_SOPFL|nr:isoliquiritigenin dimethylallyltransferase [Sophora flavescens]
MGFVLPASFPRSSSITTGSYGTTLWHKSEKIQKEYCVMLSSSHNLKHRHKVIHRGSSCQECERKYVVNATSGQLFEYEPQATDIKSNWDSIKDALNVFYSFMRPYSAIAAAMGATSVSLLAVEKLSDLSLPFFIGWLQAVVFSFIVNIFNCGLNELCDVELDKINKPNLPLVSGELSFRTGVLIVASSLIMSFGLTLIVGSWPLFWSQFASSLLAAAYSINLPLLRWKKYPILAATSILTNVAVAVPLGYFLHMQTHVFKRPATFPRPLNFCIAILSLFFVVIALFKDIPDIEGDKKFGVQSLAVRLGQKRVFWICISLLEMAYGVTILVGATSPFLWSKISTGLGHAVLASIVWNRAKSVDLKNKDSYKSFYMFIWKLICAEYCLIPLFR